MRVDDRELRDRVGERLACGLHEFFAAVSAADSESEGVTSIFTFGRRLFCTDETWPFGETFDEFAAVDLHAVHHRSQRKCVPDGLGS